MKKPTSRGISVSIGNTEQATSQTWEEAIWMAGYNYAKRQLTKKQKKMKKTKQIEEKAAQSIDSEQGQVGYVMGYVDAQGACVNEGYKEMLPNDEECSKWFDENIGSLNDHSASSAIYKFRMWLNER